MDRTTETLHNGTTAVATPGRREWTKPEAKAAEVAKATLGNGGPNQNLQDHVNCGS